MTRNDCKNGSRRLLQILAERKESPEATVVQGGRRTSVASGAIGHVDMNGTTHIHVRRPESTHRRQVDGILAEESNAVRPWGRNEWKYVMG